MCPERLWVFENPANQPDVSRNPTLPDMSLAQKRFEDLKTGGKLPSPSGVALRLIELTRQEDVSVDELARAAQADPALCGRLIKFANSALQGPRRPMASVFDAIQRIGVNTVRQLVLGFSVLGGHRTGGCRNFNYSRFWSRSLATAIAANTLCLRVRVAAADEAFTCGLLADVGSLALATLYPKEYAALLEAQPDATRGERAAAERRQFDVDHVELCAALLEDWRLPGIFINAIQHHENPEVVIAPPGSRDDGLLQLLALAAALGDYCVAPETARKSMVGGLVLQAARVGVDAESLEVLVDQVVAAWREWGRILEVQTQDIAAFADHAVKAAEPGSVDRTRPHGGLDPLDILIADDDESVRMVLEAVLIEQGHHVIAADNGRDALKLAVKHNPQLIISDWKMPHMEGPELCRTLRRTEQGNRIYFILLTGLGRDEEIVEGFEAGADDYVTKPFNPRVLTARLRAAARVVQMQAESERDSAHLRKFATELAVANRRLQQAALTDALTGMPNRRHLLERMEQEWAGYTRSQRPFSVMLVDIDRFKAVNDTHGHEAGDHVLREVGQLLRQAARVEDVVGRLGGEEFLAISPGTTAAMALRLAERLRERVAAYDFQAGGIVMRVTVSIGLCEAGPGIANIDAMMRCADAALYRAKHGGRNCVQSGGMAGAGSKRIAQ